MSNTQFIDFRKVRDFGDVLNVTFAYLRQNMMLLGKSLLFIAGPVALAGGLSGLGFVEQMAEAPVSDEPDFSIFGWSYFLLIGLSLFSSVLGVTVVNAHMMLYTEHGGPEGFDFSDIWEKVKEYMGSMVRAALFAILLYFASAFIFVIPLALTLGVGTSTGSMIVIAAFLFIGTIVWILGFFYFVVIIALIFPVKMHESLGIFDAFTRCRYLMRNNYLNSFAVLIVSAILMTILGLLFNAPGYALSFMGGFHALSQEDTAWIRYPLTVASVLGSLASSVLYAVPFSAMAMQYFTLVEKKDKTGLINRIDDLSEEIDELS